MPNYLSPGVYVEEVSGGVKPVAGVGTSTGAFVGITEKGVIGKAVLVTNWTQFVKEFGSFIPNPKAYLAYGVFSFFAEGGTSCYVVRAESENAMESSVTIKDKTVEGPTELLKVTARSAGKWGNEIAVKIEEPSEKPKDTHFKLIVKYREELEEEYEISFEDIEDRINDISEFINVEVLLDLTKEDNKKKMPANGPYPLSGGIGGDVDGVDISDFTGDDKDEDEKKGLRALDEVDDINIIAIPDKAGDRNVISAVLNYCKNRKDCFFVADPPPGANPTKIKEFKYATGGYKGENAFNNSFGALYYPWVYVSDPLTGKKKLIPPSGAVAGTYAYTDSTRGVHKAPAGTSEGHLDSVVGIERIITKGEHDTLNPAGINVIRSLIPSGICIWGARTLSDDPEWRYINVRRLLLYIEESIDEGTQWVVFEPNDPALWGTVKRNITAFLLRVWRDGALFGSTPEEAFYVKVDAENNPPEKRDAGELNIEVGVAPVKPAEFVIIRITQKTLIKA